MKKIVFVLTLLLSAALTTVAQDASLAVVTLKNGTKIQGVIKQFDPSSKIVISVAGFDTTISMSDVLSVTTGEAASSTSPAAAPSQLPNDTVVNICGQDVKFILMKGGRFSYGFDGRGSLSMKSEPVHDVELSPYYVSEEFVSRDLYKAVMNVDYPTDFSIAYKNSKLTDESLQKCAFFMSQKLSKVKKMPSVEDFMQALQKNVSVKIDIPTEVQWFYYEASQGSEASLLKKPELLYCEFAKEVSMSGMHDPEGQSIVVKGSTSHNDKEEFLTYRLYDRDQRKTTNVFYASAFSSALSFKLWDKTKSNVCLCPIRLVIQVRK